jgi:hypothetical protein
MKKKQNIMKKALLLVLCLSFLVGCDTDSETNSDFESVDLTRNVDLTKIIDPDTARAEARFDNSTNGIYKGVFVSDDMKFHGVLTVNVGNDSQYNAILEYGDDEKIGFLRVDNNSKSISNVVEFRGGSAGFTLDVSDYKKPVVTAGYINGVEAQMKLVKEKSANRIVIVLGTFSDDRDPSFNGTWDLIGFSGEALITVPTTDIDLPLPPGVYPAFVDVEVQTLDELVVTINGVVFTDDKMESFRAGANCLSIMPNFPNEKFLPFASGEQTQVLEPLIPGPWPTFVWDIDEYAVGDQISLLGGNVANWNVAFSYASRRWPNGTEGDYWTTNCVKSPLGGTWNWSGRRGHILLIL